MFSPASFRDPAGYIFYDGHYCKRVVTARGAGDYRWLISSGLYERLVAESLLIPHREEAAAADHGDHAVLFPEQIPYISYPYEWSFGQLQDAGLLTSRIQQLALEHGMSLKDASAFNVQFRGSRPVFIDTLSFERNDGGPWAAYNQFCRHFLAPLSLMSRVGLGAGALWRAALDGLDLDLTSALLPRTTYLNFGILLHIHLHARSQRKYADSPAAGNSRTGVRRGTDRKAALADSLHGAIAALRPRSCNTGWQDYYASNAVHYSAPAEASKRAAVIRALDLVRPAMLYDLGGNIGEYTRLATSRGVYSVCFDFDPLCVHHNYRRSHAHDDRNLLPLLMDLTNPSPALGFALEERGSMFERGTADMVMALALVHHLRITGNAPFGRIAAFLARLGRFLLLEYVPKTDSMVEKLLRTRKDTFHDYTDTGFHQAFAEHFEIVEQAPVADTGRTMILFRRRA